MDFHEIIMKGKLNIEVKTTASFPTFSASEAGRVCYDSTLKKLFFNNGTTWIQIIGNNDVSTDANTLDGLDSTAFLKVSNNLSDLANKATARVNLQLSTYYCQLAQNLADLPNKATARTNLDVFKKTDYFADIVGATNKATARANLDLTDAYDSCVWILPTSGDELESNKSYYMQPTSSVSTPSSPVAWDIIRFTPYNITLETSNFTLNFQTGQLFMGEDIGSLVVDSSLPFAIRWRNDRSSWMWSY